MEVIIELFFFRDADQSFVDKMVKTADICPTVHTCRVILLLLIWVHPDYFQHVRTVHVDRS